MGNTPIVPELRDAMRTLGFDFVEGYSDFVDLYVDENVSPRIEIEIEKYPKESYSYQITRENHRPQVGGFVFDLPELSNIVASYAPMLRLAKTIP